MFNLTSFICLFSSLVWLSRTHFFLFVLAFDFFPLFSGGGWGLCDGLIFPGTHGWSFQFGKYMLYELNIAMPPFCA